MRIRLRTVLSKGAGGVIAMSLSSGELRRLIRIVGRVTLGSGRRLTRVRGERRRLGRGVSTLSRSLQAPLASVQKCLRLVTSTSSRGEGRCVRTLSSGTFELRHLVSSFCRVSLLRTKRCPLGCRGVRLYTLLASVLLSGRSIFCRGRVRPRVRVPARGVFIRTSGVTYIHVVRGLLFGTLGTATKDVIMRLFHSPSNIKLYMGGALGRVPSRRPCGLLRHFCITSVSEDGKASKRKLCVIGGLLLEVGYRRPAVGVCSCIFRVAIGFSPLLVMGWSCGYTLFIMDVWATAE